MESGRRPQIANLSNTLVKIDQSSRRGVGVFFPGHEESPEPEAGTCCPLSDLWCQARREMRTQRGSTAHRSASRSSIDRKGPNLATHCQHSTRPDNRLRVSLTFGATCRQIAQVSHHPCCSQGVSLRHGGAHRDAFAPLSPPILFSAGKSCVGLPGDHEEHEANDLT